MSDQEIHLASEALQKIVRETTYGLILVRKDQSLRFDLVHQVNEAVGREVVTDLYLERLNIAEDVESAP